MAAELLNATEFSLLAARSMIFAAGTVAAKGYRE